jgi:hypothetical protein
LAESFGEAGLQRTALIRDTLARSRSSRLHGDLSGAYGALNILPVVGIRYSPDNESISQ